MSHKELALNSACQIYEAYIAGDFVTRHNSADSVPTSNLVCTMEIAIRTTFSHMIHIDRIIYYTCSLVVYIQCTRYKMPSTTNCVSKPLC